MSEQQSQDLNEQPESLIANTDWLLQMLINLVNGNDMAISITLNVGGAIIYGDLVSGHKYLEQLGLGFSRGLFGSESEESRSFAESFKKMGDAIYDKEKLEDPGQPAPSFIHLKNAKFIRPLGQTLPESGGFWWRGKVSAIDGFFLESLIFS